MKKSLHKGSKKDLNKSDYTIIEMKTWQILGLFILLILLSGYNAYSITKVDDKVDSLFDNTKFTEINKKVKESVVTVLVKTTDINSLGVGSVYVDEQGQFLSKGTGFVIDDNGTVMTARHVIGDSKDVENIKILVNGQDIGVKVIDFGIHPELDLALIKTDLNLPPLEFDNRKSVDVGSKVAFIGFPLDNEFQTHAVTNDGIVSSISEIGNFEDGTSVVGYTINSFINFGNSGGPVFLADSGKVIGIINARESTNPILPIIEDRKSLSKETNLILDMQIVMFREIVRNSQVGIGYSIGLNQDLIEKI